MGPFSVLFLNNMAPLADIEKNKGRKARKKETQPGITSKERHQRIEKFRKVAGMFLVLLSVLMLMSFISFIFSPREDMAEAKDFSWEILADKDNSATNLIGWWGAWISYLFFFKGFGIASFLVIPILFVAGWKLMRLPSILSWQKTLLYCIPLLLWLSATLGLITALPFYGGAFGVYVGDWMQRMTGWIGSLAILIFLLLSYGILFFDIDFLRRLFSIRYFTRRQKQPSLPDATEQTDKTEIEEWQEAIARENMQELIKQGKEEIVYTTDELIKVAETASLPDNHDELEIVIQNKEEMIQHDVTIQENPTNLITQNAEMPEAAADAWVPEEENSLTTPYDPRLDLPYFKHPPLDLLQEYGSDTIRIDKEELERNKNQIIETLRNYGIEITRIKATIGPTVTLYEIVPAPGIRISKIKSLEDDIALSLLALGIRIIAPIPGKGTIGIEVPNVHKEVVSMKSMLASEKFQQAKMDLPIALGKTISNEIFLADLARMPHLLMAGATGQGKSVGINSILISLLYKKHPSELKLVLVDPKKVELSLFRAIEKHYLAKLPGEEDPIITDTKKVVYTLNALCVEMDNRYELMKEAGVRNIKEYNAKFIARRLNPLKGHQYLPYIVLVIDEFADLMMTAGKEVETPIARLAQLARAVGIHLVIATQRPSVNIITGVIKANFPARIAFKVSAKVDSRTILDTGGADQLIGRGDMLFSNAGEIIRLQCGFVDTPEVEAIANFIGNQPGYSEAFRLPEYEDEKGENMLGTLSEDERDPMFEEAARIIVSSQIGSTSMLQRKLKLGYNRAGRLMDQLEQAGIVGPNQGSKPREVLFRDISELEQFLRNL